MPSTTTGSVEGRMVRLEYNVPASSVTFKKVAPALKRMKCQCGTETVRLGRSVFDSSFVVRSIITNMFIGYISWMFLKLQQILCIFRVP